jgi:hypothetical protein
MDIYSIDVTLNEIMFIRQALDLVTISGKDAKYVASLQYKLENEIQEIQKANEDEKTKSLKQAIEIDKQKYTSK